MYLPYTEIQMIIFVYKRNNEAPSFLTITFGNYRIDMSLISEFTVEKHLFVVSEHVALKKGKVIHGLN
jgi:hypothetical protein